MSANAVKEKCPNCGHPLAPRDDLPAWCGEPIRDVIDRLLYTLPVRAANALCNQPAQTFREFLATPHWEMLKQRNYGRKTHRELVEKLASLGVTWPVSGRPVR